MRLLKLRWEIPLVRCIRLGEDLQDQSQVTLPGILHGSEKNLQSAIEPDFTCNRFFWGIHKTIHIYTFMGYYQLGRVVHQSWTMLREKISSFIDRIGSIDGIAACALVSRDGIISGKQFDRELNEPWFGALSATILASAESIGSIIKSRSVFSVTIRGEDSSVLIVGAGEHFLIAAILREDADLTKVHSEILTVAQKIGVAM